MLSQSESLHAVGIDAIAIKPESTDVTTLEHLDASTVVIDFEGLEHVPRPEELAGVARARNCVLSVPVRVDGFDPLGDDSLLETFEETVSFALIAGHPAYLTSRQARRAVAPRLRAALERYPDSWVGTEGLERIAMATGATQYDLLDGSTERSVRAIRAAGFDGDIVVYAPTVVSDEHDHLLDAVGPYVARRKAVADRLADVGTVDANATGRDRAILLEAIDEYSLVGTPERIDRRVRDLDAVGVSEVVAHLVERNGRTD